MIRFYDLYANGSKKSNIFYNNDVFTDNSQETYTSNMNEIGYNGNINNGYSNYNNQNMNNQNIRNANMNNQYLNNINMYDQNFHKNKGYNSNTYNDQCNTSRNEINNVNNNTNNNTNNDTNNNINMLNNHYNYENNRLNQNEFKNPTMSNFSNINDSFNLKNKLAFDGNTNPYRDKKFIDYNSYNTTNYDNNNMISNGYVNNENIKNHGNDYLNNSNMQSNYNFSQHNKDEYEGVQENIKNSREDDYASQYDRYINNFKDLNNSGHFMDKKAEERKSEIYNNMNKKQINNSNEFTDKIDYDPQLERRENNRSNYNSTQYNPRNNDGYNQDLAYDNINLRVNTNNSPNNFSREYIDSNRNSENNMTHRAKHLELDNEEITSHNLKNQFYSEDNNEFSKCGDERAYEMTCGYMYGRSPKSTKKGFSRDIKDLCLHNNKVITLDDGTEVYYKEYDKSQNQCNQVNVKEVGEVIKSNCIDVKFNKDDTVIRSDLIVEKTKILRVWGRVKDNMENPISNAIVSLLRPANTMEGLEYRCCATTLTDYMGLYEFEVENDYKDIVYRVVVSSNKKR